MSHRFLPVQWDQTMIKVFQSLGSRPILVQELFTPVPLLFGTTSWCLSVQPFQLLPLRIIWRHISLTWPFPHRYRHAPWPVDVTELFPWFCCWTLIRLSRHPASLRRGSWHYRSLIDWLNNSFGSPGNMTNLYTTIKRRYRCLNYFAITWGAFLDTSQFFHSRNLTFWLVEKMWTFCCWKQLSSSEMLLLPKCFFFGSGLWLFWVIFTLLWNFEFRGKFVIKSEEIRSPDT